MTSGSDNSRYHIPNLERGLRVMEFLGSRADGATLTEIVDGMGIPKNSVFRITVTLLDNGYLTRNEDTMKFRLTRKFLGYGLAAVTDRDIVQNSMGVMRELRDVADASVLLGTLIDAEGVVLGQVAGGHPFKLSVDLGARFNLHSGAPGKVLLAYLAEKECETIMKTMAFQRFNERTITDKGDFCAELQKVRENGYAIDRAEEFDAVNCVGAPVFDHSGTVVAAIWITGQVSVLPEERFGEYGPIVKEHALRISQKLGFDEHMD